jgi:hypothetical protein
VTIPRDFMSFQESTRKRCGTADGDERMPRNAITTRHRGEGEAYMSAKTPKPVKRHVRTLAGLIIPLAFLVPTSASAETGNAAPLSPSGCYPLSKSGNCYEPGQLCRTSDHGASGVAGDGRSIVCANNDGWRWEPA